MLISNEWLKDYVNVDQPVQDLAERITRTGIEVDDIIDYTKYKKFSGWSCCVKSTASRRR